MFEFNWKRILAVIGFILVVIMFAYLLYALFFSSPTGPATTTTTTSPGGTGGLPTIGNGTPGQITTGTGTLPAGSAGNGVIVPPGTATTAQESVLVNQPTEFTTLNGDTALWYQQNDGHFYSLSADGQPQLLSNQVFHNVENVTWSPNRSSAVLEYPDGSNIVYNFQTKDQVTLPKHWQDFSFSPSGDQLAFESLGIDKASRYLGVSNPDGSQAQAVEALGDNADKVDVQWSPNRQVVALYHENNAADQEEVFLVGLNGENFRSLTAPGIGFKGQWTPDGQRLLYSVASSSSSYKPSLWVTDASGDNIGANRHSLDISTWVDKCTFASGSNLVCAVPQSLPDGSGLVPIDIANGTPDDLVGINLDTGQRTLLVHPASPVTASSVLASSDGKTILVHDQASGKIIKFNVSL